MSSPDEEASELGELADKLVEAALNGDPAALKEVTKHLADSEDTEIAEVEEEPIGKAKPTRLNVPRKEGESYEQAVAQAAISPLTLGGLAQCNLLLYGRVFKDETELPALVEALQTQVRTVAGKNLERGAEMLATQAHTLDALYNVLLNKALIQTQANYLEMFFKVALRAQLQCRATWEAISAIQNPPLAGYVGQANIANNQQVNNGAEGERARENEKRPNKLLEQTTHEPDQWMDRGTPAAAAGSDSAVEAVGEIHRTED